MTASRSHRGEAGTTLIELIVAVAIMGFAMLAILGGIGTAIIFTDIQRREAATGLVLTSTAEKLVSDGYTPCAGPGTYQVPSPDPAVFTLTVTKVRFWDPSSNTFVAVPSCNADPAAGPVNDNGLQLLDLSVVAKSGRRTSGSDIQVVKRQVEA